MSAHSTVFITVPKYVAITPAKTANGSTVTIGSTLLPKIKPAPSQTLTTENVSATIPSSVEAQSRKSKKRRLDHLSWEEKVQRKKLKNRVAAQTSRDRKKARMEEMEHEIQELTEKTEILANKCESLQVINDSLLEKNNKLDLEVEKLRQQLQEIQKQQHRKIATCVGSGIKLQGQSVVTRDKSSVEAEGAVKKECNGVVAMACDSHMPSLQDVLLPNIRFNDENSDAEYDAGKLEELAESLLADITADLEANDRAGYASDAENASGTKRLLGSMVGPATEFMESGQHKNNCNDSGLKHQTKTTLNQSKGKNSLQTPELIVKNECEEERIEFDESRSRIPQTLNIKNTETTTLITTDLSETSDPILRTISPETDVPISVIPDMVYGTYDAKTNSITIEMDDVAVPVGEAVEEINCDGVPTKNSSDDIVCTTCITSPSHVYLNMSTYSDDETDFDNEVNFNLDPIESFSFGKQSLVSPLCKSPVPSLNSATSDHGYESIIDSPPPSYYFEPLQKDLCSDEFGIWSQSFNELFSSF